MSSKKFRPELVAGQKGLKVKEAKGIHVRSRKGHLLGSSRLKRVLGSIEQAG